MSLTSTTSGVVVEKPWYLSKKVWLCVIALALAVYQDATGRWANVTPDQIAAHVAATASWLLPILGTILSLAHVDAKTRAAALISDAVRAAASLESPDAPAASPSPSSLPGSSANGAANPS